MKDYEIIGSDWYTEHGKYEPIGIVLIKDTYTQLYKAYIGTGKGESQSEDEHKIIKQGAKFPIRIAAKLIGLGRFDVIK